MSKTAMAWLALYSGSLLATWNNPIYGVMGIMTEYYRRPGLQWWGDELPRLRWNLIVTAVFAVSVLVKRASFDPLPRVHPATLFWWTLFAINLWMVNLVDPIDRVRALEFGEYWSKVGILMPALLVMVLRSRQSIDLFMLAQIIGVGLWGWEAYTDPKREASRLVRIGSGDTLNDNMAANHIVLMLPLFAAILVDGTTKLRRAIAVISLPLAVNTLILCNSRGSMVGLVAALGSLLFLAKKGQRSRAIGLGIAVVTCFLLLADTQFFDRQRSITNYEEDGSATGRLEGWRQAGRIISDYPLGVGARGFHVLIPKYSASLAARHEGEERAPHNTVIQVATEYGVLGILFWLMLHLSILRMLLQARRRAIQVGDSYHYYRSVALTLGLISCLVSAVFSDRLYSEGLYWIMSLAIALHRVQASELAAPAGETSAQAHAA